MVLTVSASFRYEDPSSESGRVGKRGLCGKIGSGGSIYSLGGGWGCGLVKVGGWGRWLVPGEGRRRRRRRRGHAQWEAHSSGTSWQCIHPRVPRKVLFQDYPHPPR